MFGRVVFVFFSLLLAGLAHGQNQPISLDRTSQSIEVDGIIKPSEWGEAQFQNQLYQNYPVDSVESEIPTSFAMLFDDEFLYVAAICSTQQITNLTLQRDFNPSQNDFFALVLSPFNDGRNGFYFYLSPKGVQGEALIEDGGNISTVWDNRWYGEASIGSGYYSIEMAIPFKTLRYTDEVKRWGINVIRRTQHLNQTDSWTQVARNFDPANLAFTAPLTWKESAPAPGFNASIIPSITGTHFEDYELQNQNTDVRPSLDAKISVTPSLNLDITVNPDFSQAEVDQQVTNLTRFSLFFPERRNFFLENNDLFARFGFRQIRPFFSRRIGLRGGNTIPILAGARLSGKLNNQWRIGLMNMQTEGVPQTSINPENFSVAALQRNLFSRSNIAAIFVNRQGFEGGELNASDFNRVLGLDYNLASADNRWYGKFFYHQSFNPDHSTRALANASFLRYEAPKFFAMWNHEYVDRDYDAQVGFVPRNKFSNPITDTITTISYWRLEPSAEYRFYPKSSLLFRHGPGVYLDYYANGSYEQTDYLLRGYYQFEFQNSASLRFNAEQIHTLLFFPTDVTFDNNDPIIAGEYYYNNYSLSASTDTRQLFSGELTVNTGTYYNGEKQTYEVSGSARIPPFANIRVNYRHDNIVLPEIGTTELNLVGTQINLTLSKSIFFNSFVQYNTQLDNININTRLQWRFKPMSDLFLVYTDNYTPGWDIRNRGLTIKFIYWINT